MQRAIGINLLMFALWGVFGIGIGALLRSQIGATVTATLLYTIGTYAALLVFAVIRRFVFETDAVFQGMVIVPSIAAQVAEGSKDITMPGDQIPAWWVGVLVMLAYGIGDGRDRYADLATSGRLMTAGQGRDAVRCATATACRWKYAGFVTFCLPCDPRHRAWPMSANDP